MGCTYSHSPLLTPPSSRLPFPFGPRNLLWLTALCSRAAANWTHVPRLATHAHSPLYSGLLRSQIPDPRSPGLVSSLEMSTAGWMSDLARSEHRAAGAINLMAHHKMRFQGPGCCFGSPSISGKSFVLIFGEFWAHAAHTLQIFWLEITVSSCAKVSRRTSKELSLSCLGSCWASSPGKLFCFKIIRKLTAVYII